MEKVILECKEAHGSVLVFSYKGGGKFSLQILNDTGTEIEYEIPEELTLEEFVINVILCIYKLTEKYMFYL